MVRVDVLNLTRQKISAERIARAGKRVVGRLYRLKHFSFLRDTDLSVVFVGASRMSNLNFQYRRKKKPTDVLSFVLKRGPKKLSGEIILCPTVIRKKQYDRASQYNAKIEYLLIHALLHLCGFDHKTDRDWKKMEHLAQQLV